MASSKTTRYPINGTRDFTAIIQIIGDTSSDFTNTVIIDVADLTGTPTNFKIKSVNYIMTGFSGVLRWDASTPTQAMALSQYDNFSDPFGDSGIPIDNDAGTGVTGKLTLTTSGLTANMWGTIIIKGYHS